MRKSTRHLSALLFMSNLLSSILINPVMAEPELLRTLLVTGNGVEEITTTLAQVELGVEIKRETATEVQQEIATRTSKVLKLLRSRNVEQLQTTGVRLNPNYERLDESNGQRILTGYIGTNTVSFCTSIEQVGTLLDETVKAGASRVDGVSFTATPKAISAAKEKALRKATKDAQAKAEVVLDSLGMVSEEIVNIRIDEAGFSQPKFVNREQFSALESRVSIPVVGGEQTVRGSVTLQISY